MKQVQTFEQLYNIGRSHSCSSLVTIVRVVVMLIRIAVRMAIMKTDYFSSLLSLVYIRYKVMVTVTVVKTYHYCWLLRDQSR